MCALHKQVKSKKKVYPGNYTLYPGYNDKFLIHYEKELRCWKVTHYSRWGFRGQYSQHGVKVGVQGTPGFMVRRNEWTYVAKFEDEIAAMTFAKEKALSRKMGNPVFLLQMETDYKYDPLQKSSP